MKSSEIAQWQNLFFFDLPLSDIYGIGCAALSLIYYGSRRGVFHQLDKAAVDLDHVEALRVSLIPRTATLLSDKYEYNLVYFRNDLAEMFWGKGSCSLKKLTRRVKLTPKQDTEPHRVRRFFMKASRPVHFAQYGHLVPTDDYVPLSYIKKLKDCFTGYLIRTPKGYSLDSHIFAKQGLMVMEKRDACVASAASPHVWTYSKISAIEV